MVNHKKNSFVLGKCLTIKNILTQMCVGNLTVVFFLICFVPTARYVGIAITHFILKYSDCFFTIPFTRGQLALVSDFFQPYKATLQLIFS